MRRARNVHPRHDGPLVTSLLRILAAGGDRSIVTRADLKNPSLQQRPIGDDALIQFHMQCVAAERDANGKVTLGHLSRWTLVSLQRAKQDAGVVLKVRQARRL
jgi:hypothetical protein